MKPRIKSPAHVSTGKMSVFYAAPCVWIVASGLTTHDTFPTHTEAITYAQQRARLTCRSCGRVMPYLEACIDGRAYCHPDKGPDCYAETSRALAIEHSGYSIPQKFMIGGYL